MGVDAVITIVSSSVAILTALFVYLKNPKNANNFYFSLLASLIGLYSVFNYLSITSNSSGDAFFWAKMILIVSAPQGVLLLFFASSYKSKKILYNKKLQLLFVGWLALVYLLAISNMIFSDVTIKESVVAVVPGRAIPVFIIVHLGSIFVGSVKLIRTYLRSTGNERVQLSYVTIGLLSSFLFTFLITLILPLVFESTVLLSISPLFLTMSIGIAAYAIIRHKLFDIRAVVARATAYLLITFFIAVGYSGVFIVIQNLILPDLVITDQQMVINIAVTVVLVISYPYLKRYFDRVTNRVFFKDAYDSQELLGNLNRTLVLSTEIEELLTKSSLLIQENLKTSFATFFIRSTSYFPDRIIGAHSDDPTDKDAEKIQELASKVPKKVIYVESYADTNHDKELYRLLKKSDIDILVRLVSTVDLDIKGIGYIFMGPKKSGNLYTKQDLKLLEIIANELVIAVENVLRFEEIEQFNVTLQKKIDTATRELKKNNEKLKALDEAKDEFVSMASHQLRTPLTSIKGYISMVLEGDAGKISATQKQMLGQALFSSQRMVYLISDLLNVSRLRTGKFLIEAKPVYLPDLVDSEINQLVEGAKSKNITMSFVKPKKFASMKLDDMKIRQVVMNFIDNAIYYTPSNGKITVSLKETQKTVEFRVKDTGIGVPKEQVSKLFTKFYRADNARKARPDGTGLGLFMAKKVIIAQGGSIIIESKENKGSTFGFTFPKSRLQVADTTKNNGPQ